MRKVILSMQMTLDGLSTRALIQKLKQQLGKNMIVVGGATVAQTFAKLGLIDEYQIVVHSVILGKGKLLLKDLDLRQKLKLIGTKTFNSGAVELIYARIS